MRAPSQRQALPDESRTARLVRIQPVSDSTPYSDDIGAVPGIDPVDDDPEEEDEQPEPEPVNVYPTLYVDGLAITDARDAGGDGADLYDLERVQLEFDDVANGMLDDDQTARAPLAWCNSATIHLDRDDDAVTVLISVGDPRGAFAFTVRRLADGSLIMHTPHPGEGMPHMTLTEDHPGTYRIS